MNDKVRIHAFYILLILGVTIVLLIAIRWIDIPRLPELVTFALTLTSLVLAVLAIVYAYVSHVGSQTTTARLIAAADAVVKSAADVRDATDELGAEVKNIPGQLSNVGERIDRTHVLVQELSTRQTPAAPAIARSATPSAEVLKRFAESSSITGLFALLGARNSLRSNKPLNLKAFSSTIVVGDPSYMHGFLIASAAANMIAFTGTADAIVPSSVPSSIGDHLEGLITEKVQKVMTASDSRMKYTAAIELARQAFVDSSPVVTPTTSTT